LWLVSLLDSQPVDEQDFVLVSITSEPTREPTERVVYSVRIFLALCSLTYASYFVDMFVVLCPFTPFGWWGGGCFRLVRAAAAVRLLGC